MLEFLELIFQPEWLWPLALLGATCECPNDCCPEVVPVTLETNNYTIAGAALAVAITDGANAVTQKIATIQVQTAAGVAIAGNYEFEWWLVDSPQADAHQSSQIPDEPGQVRGKEVTDANGQFIINLENAVLDTWYMNVSLGAGVTQSAAITMGS